MREDRFNQSRDGVISRLDAHIERLDLLARVTGDALARLGWEPPGG